MISATGTYANPYLPDIPGKADYQGNILHSAAYRGPEAFAGQRVIVAGEGNSGARRSWQNCLP